MMPNCYFLVINFACLLLWETNMYLKTNKHRKKCSSKSFVLHYPYTLYDYVCIWQLAVTWTIHVYTVPIATILMLSAPETCGRRVDVARISSPQLEPAVSTVYITLYEWLKYVYYTDTCPSVLNSLQQEIPVLCNCLLCTVTRTFIQNKFMCFF